ncbi:MAG TPA: transketolase C-terminal domain-containing protein [bacterium]|nr:transketolase C-terminal domain-containing protein [bacterium]HNS48587.1 transketolase C-terminal domain-containing protein [bacterium]
MKDFIEGSDAVARAVALCRPGVISAYPITPQTHIVEFLASMVADGKLKSQFINVESEHSAASLVLGASAAGERVFSASSSQGLILMSEVLFNIAGMRMPVVLACVNRALSAPINIWNDQQDSMAVRDSGWIQLYAETGQECGDLIFQAYRLAESPEVRVPVMVCLDGYLLSHGLEVVDVPEAAEVDKFLPPYRPAEKLDPAAPMTFGPLAGPDYYLEIRHDLHAAMRGALKLIPSIAADFSRQFGRNSGGLIEGYRLEDAELAIVAAGSVCGTIKEAIDALRQEGVKAGLLRLITYRPFPEEAVSAALAGVGRVAVLDKAISLGATGPIYADLATALVHGKNQARVNGYIAGLGGRDITIETIREIFTRLSGEEVSAGFVGLKG